MSSQHVESVAQGNRSAGLSWSIGDDDYEVREQSSTAGSAPPHPLSGASAQATPGTSAGDSSHAAAVFSHFADGPTAAPAAHHTGHGSSKDHGDGKGPGLKGVQKVLQGMGLYEHDAKHHNEVDGKMGPRTFAAIKKADKDMQQELLKMLSPHELVAYNQFAGGDAKKKAEPDLQATKEA